MGYLIIIIGYLIRTTLIQIILMMFIGQLPFGKLAKLAGILMLALVLFLVLLKFTPAAITQYLPDRFVTWQGRLERFFDGHKDNLDESGTYKITDDNYQYKATVQRSPQRYPVPL